MSLHWTLYIKNKPQIFLSLARFSHVLTLCINHYWKRLSRLPAPFSRGESSGSIGLSMLSVTAKHHCAYALYIGARVFYIYILGGVMGGMEKYSISLSQNNVCKSPWSILCVSARVWVRAWECLTSYSLCVLKICEFYFFFFPAEAIVTKKV